MVAAQARAAQACLAPTVPPACDNVQLMHAGVELLWDDHFINLHWAHYCQMIPSLWPVAMATKVALHS